MYRDLIIHTKKNKSKDKILIAMTILKGCVCISQRSTLGGDEMASFTIEPAALPQNPVSNFMRLIEPQNKSLHIYVI